MSCNGCRILRKGCNENCILRQSLQSIESPQSQANATIFVAKFFGRAGLMSFLSSVPESQRPALFQSLLFEACGRTINPVNGAVGLLWTGNWQVCQSAVETVLTGGVLRPLPEFSQSPEFDEGSEANITDLYRSQDLNLRVQRKSFNDVKNDLNLGLTVGFPVVRRKYRLSEERRPGSPSDESEMTTLDSDLLCNQELQQNRHGEEPKHLRLFF